MGRVRRKGESKELAPQPFGSARTQPCAMAVFAQTACLYHGCVFTQMMPVL